MKKNDAFYSAPSLRSIINRLLPYMKPYRGMLGGGFIALLGATLMKLVEPWPIKFVIDHIVPTASDHTELATQMDPFLLLVLCAVGLALTILLRSVLEYAATISFALAGNRILTAVRSDLFQHLQSLPISFHAKTRVGDLTMRLVGDVGMLKETMVTAALPLVVNIFVFLGMVSVMIWLNWQLALIALSPAPILFLMSRHLTLRIRDVSRKQRKRQGELASTSSEVMSGIRSVQALGLENHTKKFFSGSNVKDMRAGVRGKKLSAGLERSVDVLIGLSLALILWFGTLSVMDGQMTPGDLLIFIAYVKQSFRPVRDYAKHTARLAKALAAAERVVVLFDENSTIKNHPDAIEAPDLTGAITFENLSFSYENNAPLVLNSVSFTTNPGSMVAIVGPSGCGKSTLLGFLLRLQDPNSGRILMDGIDIQYFTIESLRSQIAYLSQDRLFVHGTINDNLKLGARAEVTHEDIEAAAKLANAHEFIIKQAKGYESVVAERGSSLSTGQQQRLALTRIALRDSRIMILDEPTLGLDRKSEEAVIEGIETLAAGRTTLLVTHDLMLASRADHVIVLQDGSIEENGTPQDLLARDTLFKDLYTRQKEGKQRDEHLTD